jgi:hypothetical protein
MVVRTKKSIWNVSPLFNCGLSFRCNDLTSPFKKPRPVHVSYM